jgi:Mg-chelatase subunit ChlD
MTSADGHGLAAAPAARRSEAGQDRRGQGVTGFTEDEADLTDAGVARAAAGAAVRAAAREIAARLAVSLPRERRPPTRGAGELTSLPFRDGADEIDLDRTMDAIIERRPLRPEDIVVRERRRRRRAVVLAVDVSGSMRGERIRTAAATVGALTAELARDDLSVVAFWSDAALLLRLGEQATLEELVDRMLEIEPVGLTNVSFPLEFAEEELRAAAEHHRRVVLLSDCVHNAGPDPRIAAARLPRLDVLFDVSGEHDGDLARDLAQRGRGLVLPIRHHGDVAPALSRILGS